MGMNAATFERACATAARTFGRKANVSVVFTGNEAKTNGSTIILPSLGRTQELTDEQVAITRGYVDHEAAHVLHTNQKQYGAAVERAKQRNDELFGTYLNALEDVRIERLLLGQYPGSRANLGATSEAVNRQFLTDVLPERPEIMDDLRIIGPIAVTWAGRRMMGQTVPSLDECLSKLSEDNRKIVETWADFALKAKSTNDIVDLAERIAKETREKHNEPEPEPAPGQGDGEGEGEGEGVGLGGGEGTSTGAGSSQCSSAKSSSSGTGERGPQGDTTFDDKLPEDSDAGGAHEDSDEEEPEPISVTLNLKNILGADASGQVFRAFTTKYDGVHHRKDRDVDSQNMQNLKWGFKLANPHGGKRYVDTLTRVKGHVGIMARKLALALMDKQRRDWGGGYEAGRFDSKRLVMAYNGHHNVYKMREESSAVNTAVQLLVDCSGSMDGGPIEMARTACVALVEALEGTGSVTEVLGFNSVEAGPDEFRDAMDEAMRRDEKYSRWWPIHTFVVKDFSEDLRYARTAIGNITSDLTWNAYNCDSESLLVAYDRLSMRPEPRKVMMVLSDGHPYYASSFWASHCNRHLRDVVNYIEQQGVELIGIGIDDDAVGEFYPKYTVVRKISDLSGVVLDMLSEALLGKSLRPSDNLRAVQSRSVR